MLNDADEQGRAYAGEGVSEIVGKRLRFLPSLNGG
jgi:hypothetical protein